MANYAADLKWHIHDPPARNRKSKLLTRYAKTTLLALNAKSKLLINQAKNKLDIYHDMPS